MPDDTAVPDSEQPSGGDQFGMPRRDIFEDPTLPSSVKLVYTALSMCADAHTRLCWPGRDRLARASSLSVRTVATAIRVGEEIGLWTVTRTQTSNRYLLHDRAGDPARYVAGSGPARPAGSHCTLDGQQLHAEEAVSAHEQDATSRADVQTHFASSSEHTPVGHTSPSVRLARSGAATTRIIRTPRNFYDPTKFPDKKVWPYLVSAVVAALEADGMELHPNAADQIGWTLKHNLGHLSRRDLIRAVREWTNAAGNPDHGAGWIAHRRAS